MSTKCPTNVPLLSPKYVTYFPKMGYTNNHHSTSRAGNMTAVNPYQRGEIIGQGGMGTVYRGHDSRTGKPVALKFLLPDLAANNPDAVERFRREGEALRQANHPNIVQFHDICDIAGQQCIVTEYVSGGSVADLINAAAPLPVEQVLQIALELADALTRAHHLNIIHRDIKPDNILLADDGTTRLTDFGLARLTEAASLTSEEMVVGTLAYLSPEAIDSDTVDERTDIWSFGVTLFEMLTGVQPFRGKSFSARCYSILYDPPDPDLETIRADIPLALTDLIYRMLEKERLQRIPSVRLVAAELWTILQGGDLKFSTPRPSSDDSSFAFFDLQSTSTVPKIRLPKHTTPFIGREREVDALKTMLTDPAGRLVSIVGQGGMGKTRLALRTAEAMVGELTHGVYFVPMAGIDTPQLMAPTIMDVLAIKHTGNTQHNGDDPAMGQLLDYLQTKALLLVLDNMEQLVEGAGVIAELLQAPKVKILVTSRERLNLRDEKVFWIQGLHAPSPVESRQALEDYSAVRLFMDRAASIRPDFELAGENESAIIHICNLVEGMPLGIELAAAWLDMLSPQEIVTEISKSLDFLESDLRDLPDRHRSMRALFDSTWQYVSHDEREVMMGLSVFRGGFTQPAATAVTGASLRSLRALTNKSLLRRDALGRYDIHELLRQFAAESLAENPSAAEEAHHRHSHYFLDFMADREDDINGGRQMEALRDIQTDLENIRRAWEWAVEYQDTERLIQALFSVAMFFIHKTRFAEGEAMLQHAIDQFEVVQSERLEILVGCCLLYQTAGMVDTSERLLTIERGETLLRRHEAWDEWIKTPISWDSSDLDGTLHRIHERLDYCRALNDQSSLARSLHNLADFHHQYDGDYDLAFVYLNESLMIARSLKDDIRVAWCLALMGNISLFRQQYAAALQHYNEGLAMFRRMDAREGMYTCLGNIGIVYTAMGNYDEAYTYLDSYLKSAREDGDYWRLYAGLDNLGTLAYHQGDFALARDYYEECLEVTQTSKTAGWEHFIRKQLGFLEAAEGNFQTARHLFQSVFRFYQAESPEIHLLVDVAIGTAILVAQSGRAELALELLYFTTSRYVADKHTQDEKRLRTELETELPTDVVANAKARADELTVELIIEILWTELS